jgi:hypothetical protein
VIFYILLTIAAGVFALGPAAGKPGHRIPLPFAAAYFLLPGATLIRSPVRFMSLASLGIAVLAGIGVARLARGRRFRWTGVFPVALAAIELCAVPVATLGPLPKETPPVYAWLKEIKDPVAIVELPMAADEAGETIEDTRYQLYTLIHGKRLVNGVSAFVPPITRDVRRWTQHFPGGRSVELLREIGVDLALVHTRSYPPERFETLAEAIRSRPDLEILDDRGDIWVLRIRAAPGIPAPP